MGGLRRWLRRVRDVDAFLVVLVVVGVLFVTLVVVSAYALWENEPNNHWEEDGSPSPSVVMPVN